MLTPQAARALFPGGRCPACGSDDLDSDAAADVVYDGDGDRILWEGDLGYLACDACGHSVSWATPGYEEARAARRRSWRED